MWSYIRNIGRVADASNIPQNVTGDELLGLYEYVYVHICMHIHTCTDMYIHIYIHIPSWVSFVFCRALMSDLTSSETQHEPEKHMCIRALEVGQSDRCMAGQVLLDMHACMYACMHACMSA